MDLSGKTEKARKSRRRAYWSILSSFVLAGALFNGFLLVQIRNAEAEQGAPEIFSGFIPGPSHTPGTLTRYAASPPSPSVELDRATSPDGLFDAVVLTCAPGRPELLEPGVFEAARKSKQPLLLTFVRLVPSGELVPDEAPYHFGEGQFLERIRGRSCFLAVDATLVSVTWLDPRTLKIEGDVKYVSTRRSRYGVQRDDESYSISIKYQINAQRWEDSD